MQAKYYCGQITGKFINQTVSLKGWVHKRRDLGGLIFLDLRDREGIVQVVIDPENPCFKLAEQIKHEYVISVTGTVHLRPTPNPDLKTGQVEVVADVIEILNTANPIPILIDDETTSETNRMTHRIIDLRGQKMQHNLRLRYKVSLAIRNFLDKQGFIDIETPVLTRSTPEGARDFLVPSRTNKGQFYALPQSPQLFKQLLMVAGFDRYYQIVKCFRDEDLRADRQPEFTQVDIETSFLNELQIMGIAQDMIRQVFKTVLEIDLPEFPIMPYSEAMYSYGSDKPDLRIPLKFIDLTRELASCGFKVFSAAANLPTGRIVALKLPSNVTLSRKEIDDYTQFIGVYGAKGLAYIKVNDLSKPFTEGLQSPIIKFLSEVELDLILKTTKAENGETLLFGADSSKIVNDAMGALRLKLGQDKGLVEQSWKPLWVVDFPMFEYDHDEKRYVACHHPFTAPKDEYLEQLESNPGACLAKAYDMVLNGWEIGGGSLRIYQKDIQEQVFNALGIGKEEAQNKFGFLLDNLQFGAPPHGGIAFGLDRIVTLMCHAESIRDVIAFPKTTKGQCLLTNAPNNVDDKQLAEVGIKLAD